MSHVICYNKGKFNVYSTISDGFLFDKGVAEAVLIEYVRAEEGRTGVASLMRAMERAKRIGHSSRVGRQSLEELLDLNQCGENETRLEYSAILKQYFS